jgi:hypothetical protein
MAAFPTLQDVAGSVVAIAAGMETSEKCLVLGRFLGYVSSDVECSRDCCWAHVLYHMGVKYKDLTSEHKKALASSKGISGVALTKAYPPVKCVYELDEKVFGAYSDERLRELEKTFSKRLGGTRVQAVFDLSKQFKEDFKTHTHFAMHTPGHVEAFRKVSDREYEMHVPKATGGEAVIRVPIALGLFDIEKYKGKAWYCVF